ncbi:MAG: hypothetical protein K0S34_577 [Bacillales bacterium]|jgi:hypothetical protein|nr:hypothetical protein [Bacillales bacterium]
MGLFDDIEEKFSVIEDGRYVVKIDDYRRETTKKGTKPIRWELSLIDGGKGQLPTKFSHVESNAGFQILLRELRNLGFKKPRTTIELENLLENLKGSLVEIDVITKDVDLDLREVTFIKRVY